MTAQPDKPKSSDAGQSSLPSMKTIPEQVFDAYETALRECKDLDSAFVDALMKTARSDDKPRAQAIEDLFLKDPSL